MFDMQNLTYFAEGNTFTGSHSAGGAILRYRVQPDKAESRLLAWAWPQDLCFERASDPAHKEFPFTAQGLEAVLAWLEELWAAAGNP